MRRIIKRTITTVTTETWTILWDNPPASPVDPVTVSPESPTAEQQASTSDLPSPPPVEHGEQPNIQPDLDQ